MKNFLSLLMVILVFSCQPYGTIHNIFCSDEEKFLGNEVSNIQMKTNDDEELISKEFLRCGNQDFNLLVVYKNGVKIVKIEKNNTIKKAILLPTQHSDIKGVPFVNGFSLNWAKITKSGFEISIEYGSRFYYQKGFNFTCRENEFWLTRITIKSFDKAYPEKWKTKNMLIKPRLSLSQFSINNFLTD